MTEQQAGIYTPEFIPYYWKEVAAMKLTTKEALVYGFIRFYLSSADKFFFSNTQLGQILYCSKTTITDTVTKLERLGVIRADYEPKAGGGTIRFIRLIKLSNRRPLPKFGSQRPLPKNGSPTTDFKRLISPEEEKIVQAEESVNELQTNKVKENKDGNLPHQTISTPVSEIEPMLGTHPDLLAYKEKKAIRAAKKALGLKYNGGVPAYAKAKFEAELAKQRAMITHDEVQSAVVEFPTLESLTQEVVEAIAKEKHITPADCQEVLETMKTRVRGQGSGKWKDMAEMLRSYVDNAIRFGHISKILTYREKILAEFGIDIAEENEEPDTLTTYEIKEKHD